MSADIALIGLAVMGKNLILNMDDHGFTVCAFNRTVEKVTEFMEGEARGTKVIGATSLADMVSTLKCPRRVMLLVKAGHAVDIFINNIVPLLDQGDIIIDGGNSDFNDSIRRCRELAEKGILFVGTGVSGGEDGARYGPSLMPGGNPAAWPHIKDIFQSIAAKVDGQPCCDWVGPEGAGHFVKMVHNGIEYGDMQLICEAYHIMRDVCGLDNAQISAILDTWNRGELESFLIEISRDILAFKDPADPSGGALVDQILDCASQKGTGKWTGKTGLDLGIPVTLIAEAVFARCLSAFKADRVLASRTLPGGGPTAVQDEKVKSEEFIEQIRLALYASKIISYAQGFMLMRQTGADWGWELNMGGIALMWRGGCIIRSVFLGKIKEAFDKNSKLNNLLMDQFFTGEMAKCQQGWRNVIVQAVQSGIPTPAFSSALAFYDGYRCPTLPANLLQAQRDYFGAHTYERLDQPGVSHHTNWTGHGGSTASTNYNV